MTDLEIATLLVGNFGVKVYTDQISIRSFGDTHYVTTFPTDQIIAFPVRYFVVQEYSADSVQVLEVLEGDLTVVER